MKRRPMLLLAILVYITLDFSLPAMPGAFVFEPADSVETAQSTGGRAGIEAVVAPQLAANPFVLPLLRRALSNGLLWRREVAPVARLVVVHHLPRATLDPAPPTEDPH